MVELARWCILSPWWRWLAGFWRDDLVILENDCLWDLLSILVKTIDREDINCLEVNWHSFQIWEWAVFYPYLRSKECKIAYLRTWRISGNPVKARSRCCTFCESCLHLVLRNSSLDLLCVIAMIQLRACSMPTSSGCSSISQFENFSELRLWLKVSEFKQAPLQPTIWYQTSSSKINSFGHDVAWIEQVIAQEIQMWYCG